MTRFERYFYMAQIAFAFGAVLVTLIVTAP